MQTAKRLEGIGEYYFSQKLREIDGLNKEGKNIINLGIGSPDLPPHPEVIRVLQQEVARPDVHAYQGYKGSAQLRNAVAAWYQRWYEVSLDAESEILPLIGSKEGIMHLCMTYINHGDIVLVPNPGYPTYRSAAKLAGGLVVDYALRETNHWFPDFAELETLLVQRKSGQENPTLMFVNYPHMPTGQLPTEKMFADLIAFARKQNLLLVHDNPYSFILNDSPKSILSLPGAKDVAVELNSLSKSQNMAGWRVGMLVGSKERINDVLRFKSNMDSGMFLPVQLAAAASLALDASWYKQVNEVYSARRKHVYALLDLLGCAYDKSQAGMFVWAKIPANQASGYSLSDEVLYNAQVFLTPGGIFGSAGDPYIRVSLCATETKIQQAIDRIKEFRENKIKADV